MLGSIRPDIRHLDYPAISGNECRIIQPEIRYPARKTRFGPTLIKAIPHRSITIPFKQLIGRLLADQVDKFIKVYLAKILYMKLINVFRGV